MSALAGFALIRHWRATFPTRGKAFSGIPLLHVIPLSNGDPACWRPAWGGVRLCGDDWWERVIFDICAASLRMTRRGVGAWDGRLTLGVGGMHYVSALACFALIRHWRATFPTRGKASFGCATLFCFTSQSYRKNGATSQSYRKIGAVSNCYEPPRGAFPRVGKVARSDG